VVECLFAVIALISWWEQHFIYLNGVKCGSQVRSGQYNKNNYSSATEIMRNINYGSTLSSLDLPSELMQKATDPT